MEGQHIHEPGNSPADQPAKPQEGAFSFRRLNTVEEMADTYPLLMQLGHSYSMEVYQQRIEEMIPHGYAQLAIYDSEICVAVAGFWISTKLYSGRYVELDNVVVHSHYRNRKLGEQMCAWVEEEARRQDCQMAMLDAYVENFAAHRFYYRLGYIARGYHFLKNL